MKVIVIGAGIGGTSAALALQKLGYDVVVYDRMRENRPVGAALSLWSNGVKVLNWLGLGPQVAALGGRMDDMAYYDGHTGDELCRFSLAPVTEQTGQRPYPVARADLQQLMMDAVGSAHIHLGKQLTAVSEADGVVTATFADGSTDTGDLLIGADGARSLVRDYVTEPAGIRPERSYSGYVNYNGLVAADERIGPLDQWTTYVGDGKRCAVMPVAGDRFYFFVDVPGPSGVVEDRMAALEAAFGEWGAPGVRALLDGIDADESLNRVEIWDIDPFDTWARGRVAILGDAAHNTAPDIGQGACSALEDSFALGIVFATSTLGVEDSLKRYERIRTERAGDLVLRARKRAFETHAFDVETTQAWYDGLRREDGTGVIRGIVGNIEGSPVELGASVMR